MGYEVLGLIKELFYGVFGNGYIIAFVLVGVLLMMLIAMRAPLSVSLMVLLPLLIGMGYNAVGNNFIEVANWVIIPIWVMLATLFVSFFLIYMKG